MMKVNHKELKMNLYIHMMKIKIFLSLLIR